MYRRHKDHKYMGQRRRHPGNHGGKFVCTEHLGGSPLNPWHLTQSRWDTRSSTLRVLDVNIPWPTNCMMLTYRAHGSSADSKHHADQIPEYFKLCIKPGNSGVVSIRGTQKVSAVGGGSYHCNEQYIHGKSRLVCNHRSTDMYLYGYPCTLSPHNNTHTVTPKDEPSTSFSSTSASTIAGSVVGGLAILFFIAVIAIISLIFYRRRQKDSKNRADTCKDTANAIDNQIYSLDISSALPSAQNSSCPRVTDQSTNTDITYSYAYCNHNRIAFNTGHGEGFMSSLPQFSYLNISNTAVTDGPSNAESTCAYSYAYCHNRLHLNTIGQDGDPIMSLPQSSYVDISNTALRNQSSNADSTYSYAYSSHNKLPLKDGDLSLPQFCFMNNTDARRVYPPVPPRPLETLNLWSAAWGNMVIPHNVPRDRVSRNIDFKIYDNVIPKTLDQGGLPKNACATSNNTEYLQLL